MAEEQTVLDYVGVDASLVYIVLDTHTMFSLTFRQNVCALIKGRARSKILFYYGLKLSFYPLYI